MFLGDGLSVVGDLNVHFDKPSDPSTSALNVVLDNLCLRQLVKVPTQGWLRDDLRTWMFCR